MYFTLTQPRCYHQYPDPGGNSVVNITYTIATDRTVSTADDAGPINLYLNGLSIGQRYHSKIQGNDLTETIDIAQSRHNGELIFNDDETGWYNCSFTFTNMDEHGYAFYIKGLKLVRVYQMAGIQTVLASPDECTCDPPNACQTNYRAVETFQQQSDFATRVDAPCNYDDCQNLSVSYWGYDDHVGIGGDHPHVIAPGETASWEWTNPPNASNNYLAPKSCLFNFNNISLYNTNNPSDTSNATGNDIKFSVWINNGNSIDFYHTKVYSHHMFHGVELTDPVFTQNNGYNDTPGAKNTLYLTVDSNASRGLYFHDGEDDTPSDPGRVNIYRVYQTVKLSEQKTITVTQTTGGTISPGTTNVWTYHNQSFNVTPNTGYRIVDVFIDEESQGPISYYPFLNVVTPHWIRATFVRQYHVTVDQSSEGIIDGPTTVDAGSNTAYTITAYCGQISDVIIDYTTHLGAQSNPCTIYPFPNISGDHHVSVEFTTTPGLVPITFIVDKADEYNIPSPAPVTFVVDGTSYEIGPQGYVRACLTEGEHMISANAKFDTDGYGWRAFAYFTYNGTHNCNPSPINITSAGTVTAYYTYAAEEPATYAINISAGAHGTVYPNPETHTIQVLPGGCATFSIAPDSGYEVASASFGGQQVTVSNGRFTAENVNGNATLEVTFQPPPTQFDDEFNDFEMNALYWQQVQVGSASCSENGQQLQVNTTGGQGWVQAGYVTADSYDMDGKKATVKVANQNGAAEMELLVLPNKVTGTDPAAQPNWYRIIRTSSNMVQVHRYLNYNFTSLNAVYASIPATISVALQNGTFYFYCGESLICSVDNDLHNNNLYVYVITSSNVSGSGAFDDFALAPISQQQFTITASAGSGGSIDPSGSVLVNQGANQSFTITADSGYNISDIVINGSIHLGAKSSPYVHPFTDVQYDQSIAASFQQQTLGITRVQHARGTSMSNSTVSATLSAPPTLGNKLIAVIGNCSPSGCSVSSISQTGVTWEQSSVVSSTSDNGVAEVEIWIGSIGSNASQTLTAYTTSSSYYHVCNVCEYSGLASSPVDRTEANNAHGVTVDSDTTEQTTQPNELWVGGLCGTSGSGGLSNPTNGFVMLDGALYWSMSAGFCEKIVDNTGNANVSASVASWCAWAGCISTFKGA